MSLPVLHVVIVARDTRDDAVRCVASVLAHGEVTDYETHVTFVDNGSRDGTPEAVRAEFGEKVDLVANVENLGFAAACNQGASRERESRLILFLNADAELLPGSLETLVADLLDHHPASCCGPAIVDAEGRPRRSVRGHPTRLALLHQHTALRFLLFGAPAYARYKEPPLPPRGGIVEVVMGACLLVRADDFRSEAGFDERYFLYFEEADLERRLASRGRPTRFVPDAVVRHRGGASRARDPERALTWYFQSLLAYVDRWDGPVAGIGFRLAFKPLLLVRLATDGVRDFLALRFRGREEKREELRLLGAFARRGLWAVLLR